MPLVDFLTLFPFYGQFNMSEPKLQKPNKTCRQASHESLVFRAALTHESLSENASGKGRFQKRPF